MSLSELTGKPVNDEAYGLRPIPCELDRTLAHWLRSVPNAEAAAELSHKLDRDDAAILSAFAERMATLAVRTGKPGWLYLGLAALLFTVRHSDLRELLLVLPLFSDAAQRVGTDPAALIGGVGERWGDPAGLLAHALPPPRISEMGYVAEGSGAAFIYRRTW